MRVSGRLELRLSGTGGQGLILAGILLAEAAGVYEGKQVVQTQSYGPEARGGASRSDVIISDQDILFPEVEHPDVLLCMSAEAYGRYARGVKAGGAVIVDPLFVAGAALPATRVYRVEATRLADEVGKRIVANVVALGAVAAITGVVGREALEQAVLKRAPHGTEELNRQALAAGFAAGTFLLRESSAPGQSERLGGATHA